MKKGYRLNIGFYRKRKGFFTRLVSVFFFIVLLNPSNIIAQDDNTAKNNAAHETENRLKKAANKYFEEGNFIEAYPLYSQLLSLYPRDPNYNYRFGACMLFTKADKNKAAEYLSFSVRQTSVDDLAYYYLGRALHLNYKFNEAIRTYKKFEQIASSTELKKYPVKHFIEMCTNGKELISNLHGLDVMRKKELNLSDYFEAYDMHSNGGTLLAEPESFKSRLDKDNNENNLIYLTPDKKHAYFSSYGSSEKNGKDIYVVSRNPDGNWGTPENLGSIINTPFDEDYPVYDVPRHTLYFCSKGHNSMGGYDIFKSVYDATNKKWSEPVNLDFPINTPDDDILFVPDTSGRTAFFSSTRSSPQGTIDVYKIAIHIHPPESIVIAGNAYADDGKTPVLCKITVKDIKTNEVVGTYMSSSDDGKYSFNLPNGGSYNFTVEASNHKTQSQPVVLPVSESLGAMKQDIKFDQSGNLQVKSYPTEIPKDSDYQLAFNFIKDQAQMDVNVDTNTIQKLLAESSSTANSNGNAPETSSGLPGNNVQPAANGSSAVSPSVAGNNNSTANSAVSENGTTNSGNGSTVTENATQLTQEEEVLNDKAAKAIDYASDKMEEAQQLQERATEILKNPAVNGSSGSNPDSIATANNLIYQSKGSEEKGIEAYQLAAEYKNDAAFKQIEIGKTNNLNSSNNTSNGSSGQTPAVNQTSGNNNSEVSNARISAGDLIRRQAEQVKEDSFQVARTNDDLSAEVAGLQQKSQDFVNQAGQTSDVQQKTALLQQADDLNKSKEEKQGEITENNNELQQMHHENSWLNSKAQKADSVYLASVNNGVSNTGNISPSPQPALQQEIDDYTAAHKYNYDSVSTDDKVVNNYPGDIAGNNATPKNVTRSKHSHYRKNSHRDSKSNTVAANNSQSGNSESSGAGNQIPDTNPNGAATINNTSNIQGNNSSQGNGNNSSANSSSPATTGISQSGSDNNNNSGSAVSNSGYGNNSQNSNSQNVNNNTSNVGGNQKSTSANGNNTIAGGNGNNNSVNSSNNNSRSGNNNSQGGNSSIAGGNGNNNSANTSNNNPGRNTNSQGGNNTVAGENGNNNSANSSNNNSTGGNNSLAGGNGNNNSANSSNNNNGGANNNSQGGNNSVAGGNGNNNSANSPNNNNGGGNNNGQGGNNSVAGGNGNNNSTNFSNNNSASGNNNGQGGNNSVAGGNGNNNSANSSNNNSASGNNNSGNSPNNNNGGGNNNGQGGNNSVAGGNGNNNSGNSTNNNNTSGNTNSQGGNNSVAGGNGNNNSANSPNNNNGGGNNNGQGGNNSVAGGNGNNNSTNFSNNNSASGNNNGQGGNNSVAGGNGNNNSTNFSNNNSASGNNNSGNSPNNNNGGGNNNGEGGNNSVTGGNGNNNSGNSTNNNNTSGNTNSQGGNNSVAGGNGNNNGIVSSANGNNSSSNPSSGNKNNTTGNQNFQTSNSGNNNLGPNTNTRNGNNVNGTSNGNANTNSGNSGNIYNSSVSANNSTSSNSGNGGNISANNSSVSNNNGSGNSTNNSTSLKTKNNSKNNKQSTIGNNSSGNATPETVSDANISNDNNVSRENNGAASAHTYHSRNGNDTGAKSNVVEGAIGGHPNNIPAAFGYHKARTPHDGLLDSLANAVPKPKSSESHSSKHSKNQEVLSVTTVQYTDTTAAILNQKAQNYFTAASSLVENAEKIRSKAQGEKDKNKSEILYNKADSLDDLIFQLNLKGDETIAEANYRQYYTNQDQINAIDIKPDKTQVYKVTAAKRMLKDADNSYRRSMSERDRANNTAILANKHTYIKSAKQDLATAILRQQSAVYLYFQVDSLETASTMGRSNSDSSLHFTYSSFIKKRANKSPEESRSFMNNTTGNARPDNSTTAGNATTGNAGDSRTGNSDNALGNTSVPSNANATVTTKSRRKSKKDRNNIGNNSTANTTTASPAAESTTDNKVVPTASAPLTLAESENVFEEVRRSPYSSSNPIPIDPPLPMGLIFKVQVGAFKNAIPQNLFQGFQPIIGLTAPEGYIRYSAGLFRVFDVAKDALGKIHGLGYPDAFLIAFYDGKRITIAEALAKLGISPPPVASSGSNETTESNSTNGGSADANGVHKHRKKNGDNSTAANENISPTGNNVASSGDNKIVVVGANTITPTKKALIDDRRRAGKKIKDTIPPNAKALSDIKGLVYTVQVGSFPKHKDFTRLKKIKQLYTSVDENGTIKYNCGTFGSMAEAKAAKDIIEANSSAKDAFITAYLDGKRISLEKASELLNNGRETTEPLSKDKNPSPKASGEEDKTATEEENPITVGKENPDEERNNGKEDNGSFEEASKNKVIYTVQIASFTGELPIDIANKILLYADEGIEPHSEKHGVTSYYAGKYPEYDAANNLQQKLYNEGFKQAVIVAYYHGKKISLQQAQSINNK